MRFVTGANFSLCLLGVLLRQLNGALATAAPHHASKCPISRTISRLTVVVCWMTLGSFDQPCRCGFALS